MADAKAVDAEAVEIGFVTDIEGNLDYFRRWVAQSRVLSWSSEAQTELLLRPGAYFVYGGDAMDRVGGGLRLVRLLVDLKRREPDRVALIAGNRDLNKLRFSSELAASDLARNHTLIPKPHWDPKAPTLSEYLSSNGRVDSKAERLKYYLVHTLGCPRTFEGRRSELRALRRAAVGGAPGGDEEAAAAAEAEVSDDEVVESFASDALPGGVLYEYLQLACVGAVFGNTLFVHGSVDRLNMGLVPADGLMFCRPDTPPPMVRVEGGVRAWVAAMNDFMRRGMDDYVARPEWNEGRSSRGGEALMALQNRTALWGRCVVSGCFCDGGVIRSAASVGARAAAEEAGQRDPLAWEGYISDAADAEVAAWLLEDGVHRVVVGHKPSGDSPAVLSSAATGVEIVSADTSYADPAADDGRGVSMAGVLLSGPSLHANRLLLYGTLADGRDYSVNLPLLASEGRDLGDRDLTVEDREADVLIGTQIEGGWWVKARLANEARPRYLCCRGSGRVVEYCDAVFGADGILATLKDEAKAVEGSDAVAEVVDVGGCLCCWKLSSREESSGDGAGGLGLADQPNAVRRLKALPTYDDRKQTMRSQDNANGSNSKEAHIYI